MDKNEKYLKSIDNTLKDILKELKRQARLQETTSIDIQDTEVEFIKQAMEREGFTTERK